MYRIKAYWPTLQRTEMMETQSEERAWRQIRWYQEDALCQVWAWHQPAWAPREFVLVEPANEWEVGA